MVTTDAGSSAQHTSLDRESRAWELPRRALRLGRSMSALFHLISVGLTATWVIAVFFGVGLFVLVPRPAKLVSGSAPESSNASAPTAETSWLLQSTNRLDRLSMAPASSPSQPMGASAVESAGDGADFVDQDAVERNSRSAFPDPMAAHAAGVPSDQAPRPDPVAPAAASETVPEPATEEEARTPVGAPAPSPTPRASSSRKKASAKPASGRPPASHAPTQAIQDVLHKHAHLFK